MVTLKKLLASSVHLGHRAKQWNPKMNPYIYGERHGIHVIDLLQTLVCLKKATNFLTKSTKKGKTFVLNYLYKILNILLFSSNIIKILFKGFLENFYLISFICGYKTPFYQYN